MDNQQNQAQKCQMMKSIKYLVHQYCDFKEYLGVNGCLLVGSHDCHTANI